MRPRRMAFTLIELLVVIAIIAVLVGLLVPAVQKVRQAANSMQSKNNLKQIGLAVHMANDTFRKAPPMFWGLQRNPGGSFWYSLLPYLEQDNLFQQGPNASRSSWSRPSRRPMITPLDRVSSI